MQGMCGRCRSRPDCRRLCPPARAWAEQDQVPEAPGIKLIDPLAYDYVLGSKTQDPLRHVYRAFEMTYAESITDFELGSAEWLVVERCGLTGKQKTALYLHYWGRLPKTGIARIMGIKKQVLSAHISRAVKALGRAIRGRGPDLARVQAFLAEMESLIAQEAGSPGNPEVREQDEAPTSFSRRRRPGSGPWGSLDPDAKQP
ncbi:MAG: hypothetical protein AB1896_05445 [Thermodesulfobacteriota bacterium]